jgi:undecaprenyl pyrophosphate phosphatase UppP
MVQQPQEINMRLTNLILLIGILAIVTYAISLLFAVMHWPGRAETKYTSLALIILGLILYAIDWNKHRRKKPASKQDEDEWDI